MAGLHSFEEFTKLKAESLAAEEAAKSASAREKTAASFKELLAEYGVTSLSELDEEQSTEFFTKLKGSKINESTTIIEEGTRGQFGKIDKNGNITSVYTHYDSYPENMLPLIKKAYKGGKNVDAVIKGGDNSGLESSVDKIKFYDDGATPMKGSITKISQYLKAAADEGGAEFVYLWDEGNKKWLMADIYGNGFDDLEPAFESFLINENYEVIYSDGISAMKKFRSEAQALDFMRDTIKSNKKLKDIAVYKPGMHSTTQTELVVAFWGNGSYLDNVSKRDPKLAAKKLDESVVTEANQDALKRMKEIIDIRSKMISDYTKKFPTVWTIETKFNASDTKKFRELQIEYKELEKEITNESLVTEASGNFPIQERRVAKKVVTQYNHIFGKKYTSLVDGGKTQLGAIKVIFQAAMEDANFSREGNEIMKNIKGALQNIVVPVSGLGNIEAKVSARRIQDALYDEASRISNAAEWGGLGIVEGTALYLESIGNEAMGAQLVASFHAQFESREVMEARILEGNEFGAARAKAIADGEDEFEVDGETYKVTKVDKDDKENAEDFAGESMKLSDMIKKPSVNEAALPKDGSIIKVSNIPVKIEYVSSKKYIGYSWKDKNNKEHYEETKVSEHSDLNSLIKTIASEIRYQQIHKNESMKLTDMISVNEAKNLKKAKQALIDFNSGKLGEDEMIKTVIKSLGFKFDNYSEEEAGVVLGGLIKKGKIPTDDYVLNNVIDVLEESAVTESEIKSADEFKEYAFTVLQKAFGEDFDEAKAQEVVDGILDKCGDDYGACVGMLQSSLG